MLNLAYASPRDARKGGPNTVLTGEFRHTVDAKNRLFIPAKHREELGEELIVARDIRAQVLKVFSLEGWNEYIAPIKKQERRVAEPALRYLHRNAAKVTPDSQGRILIPTSLLGYAEIEREAIFVGCSDYCEIWSAEKYKAEVSAEDPEDIREKLERLGL